MGRPGRAQGELKGETEAANALARFLRELTHLWTLRELEERYGGYGGKRTTWSTYRSGEKIIPLHLLQRLLHDLTAHDPRARAQLWERALRLHQAAEEAAKGGLAGEPLPDERRGSSAGSVGAARAPDSTGDQRPPAGDGGADPGAGSAGEATGPVPGVGASGVTVPPRTGETPGGRRRVRILLVALVKSLPQTRRSRWLAAAALSAAIAAIALIAVQRPHGSSPQAAAQTPSPSPVSPHRGGAAEAVVPTVISAGPADDVYVLAPGGVYRWTIRDSGWTRIGARATSLLTGPAGVFVTTPDGRLLVYGGKPDIWQPVSEPGAEFAISGTHVYRLAADRSAIHRWNGRGKAWSPVGGPAEHLYGGGAGLYASAPDDGGLREYRGKPGDWVFAGTPGAQFAVGDSQLYGLDPERTAVFARSAHSAKWIYIGGPSDRIHADADAVFSEAPKTGRLWKYTGKPNIWLPWGEAGSAFAAGGGQVYRVSADGKAVFRRSTEGGSWSAMGGPPGGVLRAG
ncbi:hypothetical protein [Streptomyces albipurpureus]|uniref:Uncharacterized protein n=1 Tax=Streptomyces albipurpureus TaxID=2897419 RepID=A0ABT0UN22_9ACTN|nr:hypothetical protein [Streptomyces sp. CWNU-1]MCM2389480.1 hypothetical protein [Streptomyces sp. CWNU-1]